MKKFLPILLLALLLMAAGPSQITAQIVDSTMPISDEVKAEVESYLTAHPPAATPYYAVTYFEDRGDLMFVSLAALDSDTEDWNLVERWNVVWIGTVQIERSGQELETERYGANPAPKMAALKTAAGGGSDVQFPWEAGKSAYYGTRAVHGSGDYGTNGMLAVDFVSGDGFGANAASANVHAAAAGTIDYICNDGTSVAVRTENNGDYFIYAHLLNNSSLSMGRTFGKGQKIGSLKYGNFDGSCGWARQQATNYHNHFMFVPANGKFQIENCILTVATSKWNCAGREVSAGGWLTGGGGSSEPIDLDDPSQGAEEGATGKNFWDYIMAGLSVMVGAVIAYLPNAAETNVFITMLNAAAITVRMFYVLVKSNFNMIIPIVIFAFIFTLELARLIWAVLRLIAKLWDTIPGA